MWKRILLFAAMAASATLGFFAAKAQVTFEGSLNQIERTYETVLSDMDLKGIKVRSDTNIVNILLIGNDFREENGYSAAGLTDTMMIATLDNKHKALKLTSLMRDILVEIPGYGSNKLNSAYSIGGVELLYQTIAQNFGIQLDGYVEVSFEAFEKVVNDVGGVEVELTESEANYLNTTNYISKKKYRNVKVGKNKLNGNQALGYCRIRKTVYTPDGLTDDYGRTWRQRTVISGIFDRVKKLPMSSWVDIANNVLGGYVTTDLTNKSIKNYIKSVMFMGTTEIHQLQIPVDGYYSGSRLDGVGSCLTIDKEAQSQALNQFIFDYNGKEEFQYVPDGLASTASQTPAVAY